MIGSFACNVASHRRSHQLQLQAQPAYESHGLYGCPAQPVGHQHLKAPELGWLVKCANTHTVRVAIRVVERVVGETVIPERCATVGRIVRAVNVREARLGPIGVAATGGGP